MQGNKIHVCGTKGEENKRQGKNKIKYVLSQKLYSWHESALLVPRLSPPWIPNLCSPWIPRLSPPWKPLLNMFTAVGGLATHAYGSVMHSNPSRWVLIRYAELVC